MEQDNHYVPYWCIPPTDDWFIYGAELEDLLTDEDWEELRKFNSNNQQEINTKKED